MLKYLLLTILLVASSVPALAQDITPPKCSNNDTPQINLDCQRALFFDRTTVCDLYSCPGEVSTPVDEKINVNFFGTTLNLSRNGALGQLMYLGSLLFLAVVAMYLVFVGIIAAYQRTLAESEKELEKSNKTITNALSGLVLIVLAVVIAQLVASFLGLGSINEIVSFNGILSL